jgi:O-antigen/teichoic acid export membrane protein
LLSTAPLSDNPTPQASKIALPEGTVTVGIGLFIAGISAYIFFKIGQQALGQDGFKPIVAMWFIAFALAPGFFLPIEQEVSRAIAHRRALGQGGLPVIKRIAPLAIIILLTLVVVIAVFSSSISANMFEGYGMVTFCLVLTLVSYAPMHLARGICSGTGRFGAYGIIIGADGAVRVIGCAVLWLAGVTHVGPYAFMIGFSPIVGVIAVGLAGKLRVDDGPEATWSEVTPNLGWLLMGSLFAAALVNAGPITVDILGNSEPAEVVTRFGNAVIFARIPLFLFQAVQAALLPRLAKLAAQRNLSEFSRGFRQLMILVCGVGVVGTIGAFLVGPQVLDLVYQGGIDRRTMTLLALASAMYMVGLATAQAVIALRGHAIVALGWFASFSGFVLIAWLSSNDLYLRVEMALVGSSLIAIVIFGAALRKLMASDAIFDPESILDAFAERPLD